MRVALACIVLAGGAPAARAGEPVAAPNCGAMLVVVRAGTTVYVLPHAFLRAGATVEAPAGALVEGRDIVLDRVRGELRLLREPVPGDTLVVRACWLFDPPPLELALQTYKPAPGVTPDTLAPREPPSALRPVTARDPTRVPEGAALQVTGNKTLAVDFGSSQDAFLRQSLDLAVSGTLAPGVRLTGVLSDRNLPLTAGGETQDLQSLDRVLVELSAPHGNAALGDVSLELADGEFGRVTRRLQGMRGDWNVGSLGGAIAAASAQGEYARMQFFGTEGLQGPYVLTDRDGRTGVSVVAGSEIVTVDGVRMNRGESADYSIDYEGARITFSNRRPISGATRITVDYQFTLNRFRRNLAGGAVRFSRGGLRGFANLLTEGDDKGRPLDLTFDATDRATLELAGDSTGLALGAGVLPGAGDYDTVRVTPTTLAFAYAGPDSGTFVVTFSRIGPGLGDYVDSTIVDGRVVYRFAGPGLGTHRVGRALPLPETHRLVSAGGAWRAGALGVEIEGAMSEQDRNTFSSRDDGDNLGGALRGRVSLEGAVAGPLPGEVGFVVAARDVGERFQPFTRLERPFAQEDWGLPIDADFERQRRVDVSAFVHPRAGGFRLDALAGRLATPQGFESVRQSVELTREGTVSARALWQRADGHDAAKAYPDGGRDHARGELGWRGRWFEPSMWVESDERTTPSDTGLAGARFRELAGELRSPRALPWRAVVGLSRRLDAAMSGVGFEDQVDARTWHVGLESPAGRWLGGSVDVRRRELRSLVGNPDSRGDLASARLRLDDEGRGLKGLMGVEITAEGENRRVRTLTFVGPGLGAYDSLGNFTGTGDYALSLVLSPELDRVARSATSARMGWAFAPGEAWRGSRTEFTFETEVRRRGNLEPMDPLISPEAALSDPTLARSSVLQRLELELAPESPGALRLRGERRVSADRTFENFAQTLDDRTASLTWRTRPGPGFSTEAEARWRRQEAGQQLAGTGGFTRTLLEQAGVVQLIYSPDARLRANAFAELTASRPEGGTEATRTLRVGPDLGLSVGAKGRIELQARRAFVSGPAPLGLLPTADPIGPPRWEGTTRADYRVRESTTLGLTVTVRERAGRATEVTGRGELRAFF